jgi:hypothetical protein
MTTIALSKHSQLAEERTQGLVMSLKRVVGLVDRVIDVGSQPSRFTKAIKQVERDGSDTSGMEFIALCPVNQVQDHIRDLRHTDKCGTVAVIRESLLDWLKRGTSTSRTAFLFIHSAMLVSDEELGLLAQAVKGGALAYIYGHNYNKLYQMSMCKQPSLFLSGDNTDPEVSIHYEEGTANTCLLYRYWDFMGMSHYEIEQLVTDGGIYSHRVARGLVDGYWPARGGGYGVAVSLKTGDHFTRLWQVSFSYEEPKPSLGFLDSNSSVYLPRATVPWLFTAMVWSIEVRLAKRNGTFKNLLRVDDMELASDAALRLTVKGNPTELDASRCVLSAMKSTDLSSAPSSVQLVVMRSLQDQVYEGDVFRNPRHAYPLRQRLLMEALGWSIVCSILFCLYYFTPIKAGIVVIPFMVVMTLVAIRFDFLAKLKALCKSNPRVVKALDMRRDFHDLWEDIVAKTRAMRAVAEEIPWVRESVGNIRIHFSILGSIPPVAASSASNLVAAVALRLEASRKADAPDPGLFEQDAMKEDLLRVLQGNEKLDGPFPIYQVPTRYEYAQSLADASKKREALRYLDKGHWVADAKNLYTKVSDGTTIIRASFFAKCEVLAHKVVNGIAGMKPRFIVSPSVAYKLLAGPWLTTLGKFLKEAWNGKRTFIRNADVSIIYASRAPDELFQALSGLGLTHSLILDLSNCDFHQTLPGIAFVFEGLANATRSIFKSSIEIDLGSLVPLVVEAICTPFAVCFNLGSSAWQWLTQGAWRHYLKVYHCLGSGRSETSITNTTFLGWVAARAYRRWLRMLKKRVKDDARHIQPEVVTGPSRMVLPAEQETRSEAEIRNLTRTGSLMFISDWTHVPLVWKAWGERDFDEDHSVPSEPSVKLLFVEGEFLLREMTTVELNTYFATLSEHQRRMTVRSEILAVSSSVVRIVVNGDDLSFLSDQPLTSVAGLPPLSEVVQDEFQKMGHLAEIVGEGRLDDSSVWGRESLGGHWISHNGEIILLPNPLRRLSRLMTSPFKGQQDPGHDHIHTKLTALAGWKGLPLFGELTVGLEVPENLPEHKLWAINKVIVLTDSDVRQSFCDFYGINLLQLREIESQLQEAISTGLCRSKLLYRLMKDGSYID